MRLWLSEDCVEWRRALEGYPESVARKKASRLVELDAWIRAELGPALVARGHLLHDDLVAVTEWKMKRGAWRARNLALVRANEAGRVERASRAALASLPDLKRPIELLCRLDGVGPATASAVLAAVRPELFAFFDEVVAAQIAALVPVAFTLGYYARYAEALRARAAALEARCGGGWTANGVAQALFTAAS